jgi:2-iminobutanoate/2-iminopropanoate deaminase
MTQRIPITAEDAPAAVGPYSHAVRHGEVLYCSGSIPLDPGTNEIVDSSLAAETEQCLHNLDAVWPKGARVEIDAIVAVQ